MCAGGVRETSQSEHKQAVTMTVHVNTDVTNRVSPVICAYVYTHATLSVFKQLKDVGRSIFSKYKCNFMRCDQIEDLASTVVFSHSNMNEMSLISVNALFVRRFTEACGLDK